MKSSCNEGVSLEIELRRQRLHGLALRPSHSILDSHRFRLEGGRKLRRSAPNVHAHVSSGNGEVMMQISWKSIKSPSVEWCQSST